MVCYLCLQHNDHNVVSSSLETLEIIFKYSNLFDFDQLLISTENEAIEETRVSQTLKAGKYENRITFFWIDYLAYPTYQRSFLSINEQQQILSNKLNEELESTSTINNEKRTSAGKLVEQLISKYMKI
jgi:hypothetical protein